MFRICGTAILALWLSLAPPANAHEFKLGDLAIASPWARATIGAGKVGVVFLTLHNRGAGMEQLVAVSTPVAKRAELHTHKMDKGIMRMRPVEAIDVAPGEAAELAPGGHHIMLMGLKNPLREGASFPLTLTFKNAGTATITVDVQSATARSGHAHEGAA